MEDIGLDDEWNNFLLDQDNSSDECMDIKTSSNNEIIRAGMESIAFLINDIYQCLMKSINMQPIIINIAGGAARKPLLQFIADIIEVSVGYSSMKDRTAYGVYILLNPEYKFNTLENIDRVFNPNPTKIIYLKKQKWANTIANLIK